MMDAPPSSVEGSAGAEESTRKGTVGMEEGSVFLDEGRGPRRRWRSSRLLVTALVVVASLLVGVPLLLGNFSVAVFDGNGFGGGGGGIGIRTVEELRGGGAGAVVATAMDPTGLPPLDDEPEPEYDEWGEIHDGGGPRRLDGMDGSDADAAPAAIEDAPTPTTGRWRGRTAGALDGAPPLEVDVVASGGDDIAGGSDAVATRSDGRRAQASVFTVIDCIPHDTSSFTQGLTYHDGILFESTGLRGRSKIRRLDATNGDLLASRDIPSDKFGEGMTCVGGITSDCDILVHITWTSKTGYVYDPTTLETLQTFTYSTHNNDQGWGITYIPETHELVVSDGSEYLHFWSGTYPFEEIREKRVPVLRSDGQAVRKLNELEYVNGYILANVWQTDVVVRIDPDTGEVLQEYDFATLWPLSERTRGANVFNGMSVGENDGMIYMTGKYWPKIYRVSIAGLGRHTDELISSMAGGWITNGIMFEVAAKTELRIFSFDINLYTESADIEVYTKDGSSVGSQLNASAWTLIGTAEGVDSNGYKSRTPLPECTLDSSVVVRGGETRSFYITTTIGDEFVAFNSGSGLGSSHSSNDDLAIVTGYAVRYPFNSAWENYVFNGHVLYSLG